MAKPKANEKSKSEAKPKCFIIMPISTPEHLVETYTGGSEHFDHVLEHLFKPAVRQAGFDPVEPKSEGSDLIHKNIVDNLATAKMVLCDMSCLNPNVFFELGIRTALNKPVCLVKDTLRELPFDTGLIQCHSYIGTLNVWDLNAEIQKLADHLGAAKAKEQYSVGTNIWWQFMGFDFKGELVAGSSDVVDLIRYMQTDFSNRLNSIERSLDSQHHREPTLPLEHSYEYMSKVDMLQNYMSTRLCRYGLINITWPGSHSMLVFTEYKVNKDIRNEINVKSHAVGISVGFASQTKEPPPVSPSGITDIIDG